MTDSLAVLIPTLGRHDRLPGVVENINATTPNCSIYFVMEPGEAADIPGATTLTREEGFGSYATAIGYAYRQTKEPLLFAAADDVRFHEGWFDTASSLLSESIHVVGTNDLANPEVLRQEHATHYLVARSYLDDVGGVFDVGPGSFLPEFYDHNWTDREFIETAKLRGTFAPCLDAVVEHMHHCWGKGPQDATADKTLRAVDKDRATYEERLARLQKEFAA